MTTTIPQPLPRVLRLPRYSTARAAVPSGAAYLASNESPFGPLPSVAAAIAEEAANIHRYPDMHASRLRGELGDRWGVDPDQVVVGTGSVGILQQIVAAYAGPGDTVVYPWRSFEAYPILVGAGGATGVGIPLTAAGEMDLPALAAAIDESTKIVVLCLPNNPTGAISVAAAVAAFVAAVPSRVMVVIDEAYAEFVPPSLRVDSAALVRVHRNVCVLRTFSKAYGLAGLRIGYAVTSPTVADALRRVFLPFGVSAVAQSAALTSLGAETELAERVRFVIERRDAVSSRVDDLGWALPRSWANFIWLDAAERAGALGAALRGEGVIARVFPSEGVRVTIGDDVANARFVSALAGWDRR
ncbi:histidinol-phosphate transaminase [Microbacterium ureisolvens]|uniref:Histidinol-phosphate aminotransferase n=1 Tax=Microbacterium ureisolvens TaxID=2781186 RepID=A0ABS7I1K9_9MICO|nr:histidinol-phosphate transaminase [Microbacterium ureisolvens]MBW9110672.1 histidinol-phosphate transaminase [Microbacterium ureisolvens]